MKSEFLLSNVLMDGMVKLNKKLMNVRIGNGFGAWEQYIIDPIGYGLNDASCLIIILDGETLWENHSKVEEVEKLLSLISDYSEENKGTKVYISNIYCRMTSVINVNEMRIIEQYESGVNKLIYDMCSRDVGVSCINIRRMINIVGEESAFSKRMEYMASCPFSMKFLKLLSDEVASLDYFRDAPRKKCLVLDFDNTLWGGVIGEEGRAGISISNSKEGKQYYDFQKMLLKIQSSGIILAAASKNNENDLIDVFDGTGMPIRESDFVCKRINWNPKSLSIEEIAQELNIGLDSLVFIDDNPVERCEVKEKLNEVEAPDFPNDTYDLEKFGLMIYERYFKTDKQLEEDLKKTEMYLANSKRNRLRDESVNLDSFIGSLKIELSVSRADKDNIQRIAQMTQKTNQFNLTTKRYSEADIDRMLSNPACYIYIGHVADKFGDNGITNLCIVNVNGDVAYIDEFLMSCRVMERKVEYDFLNDHR